ncbi:hypothetical protein GCM10010493_01790 [Streptomyces lavendulae subsp. grasserius]
MYGLHDGVDAVGGAPCPSQDLPRFQQREGSFTGCPETGMVEVERLALGRLDAVVVAGGADGGAGALVGAVGQDQDLAGEAGLDDAVGAGRGQVGRGCGPAEPLRTTAVSRPGG